MRRWVLKNREWLFSGIGVVIGTSLLGIIFSIVSFVLVKIKSLEFIFDYLFSFQSLFFINLLSVFLIVYIAISLFQRLPFKEIEPDMVFANKIIFRKVKFGPRVQQESHQFALSVRALIKNNVEIFDTKLTLIYMHYRQVSSDVGTVERHGVEEFSTTANYVDTIHRYSLFSDELSYRTLKPISEARGSQNHDQIRVILTGFYGRSLKRFLCTRQYSFDDIKFADTTPKVVTYEGESRKKVIDISRFHEVDYLQDDEIKERKEALQRLLKSIYIEPDESDLNFV